MSCRGEGEECPGKDGAKRHREVLRGTIQGIKKPFILRQAHHSGEKRISVVIYKGTWGVLKVFLQNVTCDAVTGTEYAKCKIVTVMGVIRLNTNRKT
ncbi:unnamed protein product [Taenia asiatica]|uniref:Histone H4 n=1 Tax=Taenia asiatica TaxID=60517 RepID=A0A0R3W0B3_TAEAS|nr:unnamed protein product [Taenia asiatica]